jgi:methylmalonyl-CoA/ethylmalonyl-CoA epimerase
MSGTGRIEALHQVAQRAEDLERAVKFYRDVVGLDLIGSYPPGLAFFNLNGTRLLLEKGTSSSVLYLRVADIHGKYAELLERGVNFNEVPHVVHRDDAGDFGPAGEEEWVAFFRDSEGNNVALAARRPPVID